jgi:branched-chain amino acid transport system permease protein
MRRWAVLGLLLAALVSVPFWAPNRFWITVATQALIFAVFAMSLDLLLGYGGMPSFGHAAFFGAGAYAYALWAVNRGPDLLPLLGLGLLAGLLLALPIGALALRVSGIYFLMLTLAFAQLTWGIVSNDALKRVFGGDIGLIGVSRPDLPFSLPFGEEIGFDLVSPGGFYGLVLLLAVLVFAGLTALVASPFGRTLEGIRENEHRMLALGCPTYRYRLAAFMVAGAVAGLAGSLFAAQNSAVAPSQLYWTTSGLVLIAVIVGGARSLLGPLLGAFLVVILQHSVPSLYSALVIGLVLICFVLFLPRGLVGLVRRSP